MFGPVLRYSDHAKAAPGANTDFFTKLAPLSSIAQIRVFVSLATGSVFNMSVTDGTTAYAIKLNGGTALTAGVLYGFDAGLSQHLTVDTTKAITYSFQVATDGIIQHVEVWELDQPVS